MKIFGLFLCGNVFSEGINEDDHCQSGEIDIGNGLCTNDVELAKELKEGFKTFLMIHGKCHC